MCTMYILSSQVDKHLLYVYNEKLYQKDNVKVMQMCNKNNMWDLC